VSTLNDKSMALNEQGEAENAPTTTPVANQEASEDVASQDIASADASETSATETEEGKKGFSSRVRELVKERNDAREVIDSLQQKVAELTQQAQPELSMPDFKIEPIVKPGEELTAEELNRRIAERDQQLLAKAAAISRLQNKQSEALGRIDRESAEVVKNFPQLDPESEEFNPELSEAITESTTAYIKSNPYTASVKNHVAKLMRSLTGTVTKEVGKATEKMAKQASETALRPTSIRKEEKPVGELSIAELEAKLGVVQA
jgi:hypothetical protein